MPPAARTLQWLVSVLLLRRFYPDPLSEFIDLMFLSNISAVVLDDRFSGYYLHGRNHMMHAGVWLGRNHMTHDLGGWAGAGALRMEGKTQGFKPKQERALQDGEQRTQG
jgi:hypothetical protein